MRSAWKNYRLLAVLLIAAVGLHIVFWLGYRSSRPEPEVVSLYEARNGQAARVIRQVRTSTPLPDPPADLYRIVHYPTELGDFSAYLSVVDETRKHPALIWVHGGDHSTLGDMWSVEHGGSDEFAELRAAGIVLMFPSLRGGNGNAGYREGYYGEVDDLLAAATYLANQSFVAHDRIYVAGHSTGGTLVLLASEFSSRFRAVFSLAPAADVRWYAPEVGAPISAEDRRGFELRSPVFWLGSIRVPTFVFEGDQEPSNLYDLRLLAQMPRNPLTHFYIVNGTDHRSSVHSVLLSIALYIVADVAAAPTLDFDQLGLTPL